MEVIELPNNSKTLESEIEKKPDGPEKETFLRAESKEFPLNASLKKGVGIRKRLATFECNPYTFVVETDPCSKPFGIVVWGFKDGMPIQGFQEAYEECERYLPEAEPIPVRFRKYFFPGERMSNLRRFCIRFANDRQYRNDMLKEFYLS